MHRAITREIDLGRFWKGTDSAEDDYYFPLILRAKNILIDNLDTSDVDGRSIRTLPKSACQQLACRMLQMEWDIARGRLPDLTAVADTVEPFLGLPMKNADDAIETVRELQHRLLSRLGRREIPDELRPFMELATFYARNHVIWARVHPNHAGRFTIKYSHDTIFVPERGVARLSPSRPNFIRHNTRHVFESTSYHFRMRAPANRFFRAQALVLVREDGSRLVQRAIGQQPYAHLYANVDPAKYSVEEGAQVQLTIWEEPPGTALGAFMIGGVSLVLMIVILLVITGVFTGSGSSVSASIVLSLPATAAIWLGVPTSPDALSRMPRLSRTLFALIGLNTIAAAVICAVFNVVTVQSVDRFPFWRFWDYGALSLTWGTLVSLQLILVSLAAARTAVIWRGSSSLRKGPSSSKVEIEKS